jgi:integral membrane sensor domain MASE1
MCLIILVVVLYLIASPELCLFDGVYMKAKKSETSQLTCSLSLLFTARLVFVSSPIHFPHTLSVLLLPLLLSANHFCHPEIINQS